jgi:DNA (cytosine-5)-methyltransferase 3A
MGKLFKLPNTNYIFERPINVLSLFDGIACGHLALNRVGLPIENYYASEINESAIYVAKNNFPNIKCVGDVNFLNFREYKVDLLIGGSPCQDISNLNVNGRGLAGNKSSLFYKYLEALEICSPRYFLLENVVGDRSSTEEISRLLGVKPIKINSALVSAQNRNRYYWTNIKNIEQPCNLDIHLNDILLPDTLTEQYILKDTRLKWLKSESGQRTIKNRYASIDPDKANCLTARAEKSWNSNYVTRADKKK